MLGHCARSVMIPILSKHILNVILIQRIFLHIGKSLILAVSSSGSWLIKDMIRTHDSIPHFPYGDSRKRGLCTHHP